MNRQIVQYDAAPFSRRACSARLIGSPHRIFALCGIYSPRNMRQSCGYWPALLLALTMAGCGATSDAPATFPVTGVVTLDGQPVAGADVAFLPAASDTEAAPAQAVTDDAGHFEVATLFDQGRTSRQGMKLGTYVVQITKTERPPPAAGLSQAPKNVLPRKYASAATSGLNATVTADGENELTFSLTK